MWNWLDCFGCEDSRIDSICFPRAHFYAPLQLWLKQKLQH